MAITRTPCQGPVPRNPGNLLQDRVLERLRRAQTNHGLGLDLDRFARLGVAAHARLAVRFYGASDIRDDELARAALALSHRKLEKLFKKERRGFLRRATLFGHMRQDFGLAHRFGHLVLILLIFRSATIFSRPATSSKPRFSREKADAARHYSQRDNRTQAKNLKKLGKNEIFKRGRLNHLEIGGLAADACIGGRRAAPCYASGSG